MAWNISVGFPKISYETLQPWFMAWGTLHCRHRLQKLGVPEKMGYTLAIFIPGTFRLTMGNHGAPNFPTIPCDKPSAHLNTQRRTTIYKSYLNIFDHIKWILNHPSINLQFLQKVNHRQPSWLSHRFPNRSSRIQASKDSTRLPKPGNIGENDENPLEKGPSSPFSDKLMLSGFWGWILWIKYQKKRLKLRDWYRLIIWPDDKTQFLIGDLSMRP